MIDFTWLAINQKVVSFTCNRKQITGLVDDYIEPEDEEDGPAFISIADEPGARKSPAYYTNEITNLKILN